jgi:hypothetical protein
VIDESKTIINMSVTGVKVIIKFDTVKVRVYNRVKVIIKFDTVKVGVCIRVNVIIKVDTKYIVIIC